MLVSICMHSSHPLQQHQPGMAGWQKHTGVSTTATETEAAAESTLSDADADQQCRTPWPHHRPSLPLPVFLLFISAPPVWHFSSSVKPAQSTKNTHRRQNREERSRVKCSMGAGKGGDGGGVDAAAAAAEAEQPVVLKMDLHCAGCAHKVKKAIKRLPGVESIVADVAAKRVVVAGTADAAALKARIEAKTGKAVEVVSPGSGSGSGPKKAAAAVSEYNKDGGAGEQKADKDGGAGEKKGDKDASPKEGKEKKQPPEETKPKEESVLLKIRLHCDGCADRIRRRIYKFKGVKDVVLDGNAKDEVKVTGTMDVRALLSYLKEKLNRPVDAVPAGKKDKGGDGGEGKDNKKDKGGGDSNKDAAASTGGDDKKGNKAKGIDTAGPSSTAAAAAFMAPPAEASTFHVPPPYGHVAYPQEGPAASSYYPYYYDMGSSNSSAATYYQQQHQAYAPPYAYHMAPPTQLQLFSDENPNACSVM